MVKNNNGTVALVTWYQTIHYVILLGIGGGVSSVFTVV